MFPLKQRKLIRGCQAHVKAGLGCGADYVATIGTPLYAPSNGKVSRQYTGTEGGKWLWFDDGKGNSLQFAHLSSYVGGLRQAKEGELIAYTGNTGSITTGPHLHVQILKGSTRLDPEKYDWLDNVPTPPDNGDMDPLKDCQLKLTSTEKALAAEQKANIANQKSAATALADCQNSLTLTETALDKTREQLKLTATDLVTAENEVKIINTALTEALAKSSEFKGKLTACENKPLPDPIVIVKPIEELTWGQFWSAVWDKLHGKKG